MEDEKHKIDEIKRFFVTLTIVLTVIISEAQPPKSFHYNPEMKTFDFFVNVLNSPNASLYDFLRAGLRTSNTSFQPYERYANSNKMIKWCDELHLNLKTTYEKVKASWEFLKK